MTSRKTGYLVSGLSALLAAAAALIAWSVFEKTNPATAGISAMPDLSRWPAEFRREIETATAGVSRGPEPVAALARLATLYFANDLTAEAERAFRTLHALEPANARWPYLLATSLNRRTAGAEAEHFYRETLKLAPEYSVAQFQLGQLLATAGRDDEAWTLYEQRLVSEPADVLATLGMVDIERRRGRPELAIRRLEDLLKAKPAAAEARLLLAEILDSSGRTQEASAHRVAAQSSGAATPTHDPWLDELYLESFDPFRLQTLGVIRMNAASAEEALPFLRRAARFAPEDGAIQDSLAVALRKTGQHEEARSVLETAVTRTNATIVYLRLADLLTDQGEFAQAEALLRKGMAAHGEQAEFHDALGRLQSKANRFEEAVEAFAEALRLNPTLTETRLNHGRALLAAGRRAEAKNAIAQAVEARPAWPEALLLLGELALEASDTAEAHAWATRALAADEKSPASRRFLARVALRRAADALGAGDAARAETIYREALEQVPEHGALHGALGALLGRQERLSEAHAAFQRFADLSPDDARAWFLLGTVLEQRGETEEAIEAFARGLSVARTTGDNQRAPLIEQALKRLKP